MSFQLNSTKVTSQLVDTIDGSTTETLLESLVSLAEQHDLNFLLSHHDDGVVWGRFVDGDWVLSSETFDVSPTFSPVTLQMCRIFGESAELRCWLNADSQLHAALLKDDETGETIPYFEQNQLLWGDSQSDTPINGFTLLREGSQGLCHAVPIEIKPNDKHRAALIVRHYIAYDNHQAYVKWSRLTKVDRISVGNIGGSK